MKVKYKREMRHNYLILEAMEDRPDSFEIRMLAGNAIDGLLRFRLKQEDQARFYYYEITSKQPLSRMLECREIRRDELKQLIFGIGEALGWIENYLLQESHVLLEPEYIYIEPESFRVWLCYVPGYPGNFPAAMERLLHYLLKKADHRDNDTVVLAYRLYQESQKDYFGIEDLLRAARESGKESRSLAVRPDEGGNKPETGTRYGERAGRVGKGETAREEKENEGVNVNNEEIPEETEAKAAIREGFSPQSLPGNKDGCDAGEFSAEETMPNRKRMLSLFPLILIISLSGLWLFRGKEGILRYGIWLGVAEGAVVLLTLLIMTGISVYRRKISSKKMMRQLSEEEQWRMTFCEMDEPEDTEEENIPAGDNGTGTNDAAGRHPGNGESTFPMPGSGSVGNTVLLSEMEEGKGGTHILKSLDPSIADIPVPYFPFLIGKQEGIVDYVLPKETVSRLHLRIDEGENGCSVTDLNSSNGTRVGEHLLNANESCGLDSGDKVIIADISFIFY